MIFAIDVGNTNIVFGCIEDGNLSNIVRIRTDTRCTDTEYAIKLRQIFDIYGIDDHGFEGAIISSVVPGVTVSLVNAVETICGVKCMVVKPGMKTGMNIRIDDPGTLAGDFVTGSVASIYCYGTPCICIDLGTATTIVAIDRNNSYLGGVIYPGIKLSYNALSSGTSLLPDISITPPPRCIGTNTVDSMRSGAVFGTASLIDGMIDRMEEELGEKCVLVATGGMASSVVPYCRHEITVDDDLLLKGLWILYNKNKKN